MMPSSLPDEILVIIVTYQSADHIQACLASLPQAAPESTLNVVVIDNASQDGTPALLARAEAAWPARGRFSWRRNQKNLGFTRAVNQGLQLRPAGAAVLFLNPDTVLPRRSLSILLQKLYAREGVGVAAPQLRFPPAPAEQTASSEAGIIQPSCRRFPDYWDLFCEFAGLSLLFPASPVFNRWKMGDFDHRSPREVDQPQGAFLLARPEVVAQVGAWDERFPLFFSDVDWCRRVHLAGWKIRFEPEIFVWHARGASIKQNRPAAIWSSHLSFWRYFRKWRRSPADEVLHLLAAPLLMLAALLRMAWHFPAALFRAGRRKR